MHWATLGAGTHTISKTTIDTMTGTSQNHYKKTLLQMLSMEKARLKNLKKKVKFEESNN